LTVFDAFADYSQSVDGDIASWDHDVTQVANSNYISSPDERPASVYNNVSETIVAPAVNTNLSVSSDVVINRLTGAKYKPVIVAIEL